MGMKVRINRNGRNYDNYPFNPYAIDWSLDVCYIRFQLWFCRCSAKVEIMAKKIMVFYIFCMCHELICVGLSKSNPHSPLNHPKIMSPAETYNFCKNGNKEYWQKWFDKKTKRASQTCRAVRSSSSKVISSNNTSN